MKARVFPVDPFFQKMHTKFVLQTIYQLTALDPLITNIKKILKNFDIFENF